jgi:N-acetylmuramoyl-L-alanine amidase
MEGGEREMRLNHKFQLGKSEGSKAEVKSAVMKKTSQVMAVLLILSMLMPVLAFAGLGFENVSYNKSNKTITGTVYSDVYNVNDNVYLAVYNESNASSIISSVYNATYNSGKSVAGATYFDFSITLSPSSVPDSVYVKAFYGNVASSVYNAVYQFVPSTGGGPIEGGGSGPIAPQPVAYTLSIEPTTFNIQRGRSQSVTKATYSNGTTSVDVTNFVSLTSANTSVATISGISVNGVSVGSTVVTATYGTASVTANVYVTANNSNDGQVGGGVPAGGLQVAAGKIEANNGKVDASVLSKAFEATSKVEVKVTGETAELSAAGLLEAAKKEGTVVTIVSDKGTYTLPLSVLKLDALAKSLGVDVKDLTITIGITKVSGETATNINAAVTTAGGSSVADAVDFTVTAVGKEGKSVNVSFGNTYVSRSLNATKALDSKKATGVLFNPVTNKFSFVPTTFETKDGKTVATLKRNGNSIYTVIEVNKSFADLASHWSKADVELLANKLVVDGVAEGKFDADRSITRAEFAALVVRSLGLTEETAASSFKDVNATAWYANTVTTATYAGIINGYEDNTFRPDATLTREELAAMVIRALNYASVASEVPAAKQAEILGKFKDANKIVWAQKEVAAAVNAGIINGLTDDTIGSSSQATRAQAATMLKRFLGIAGFIN